MVDDQVTGTFQKTVERIGEVARALLHPRLPGLDTQASLDSKPTRVLFIDLPAKLGIVSPMMFPRALDRAFLEDLQYDPDVLFFDQIESMDIEKRSVVCRARTDRPLPITDMQRCDPIRHPRHISGAIMVHLTAMLGFVHAYYIHELRHADGWTGYGTHIHRAVFRKLAPPGMPLICCCTETRLIKTPGRRFSTYDFEIRQEDQIVYESKQSAMWLQVGELPLTDTMTTTPSGTSESASDVSVLQ